MSKTMRNLDMANFLAELTDWNRHSERVVVEAIITGEEDLIKGACEVLLQHYEDGHLSIPNGDKRRELIKKIDEKLENFGYYE